MCGEENIQDFSHFTLFIVIFPFGAPILSQGHQFDPSPQGPWFILSQSVRNSRMAVDRTLLPCEPVSYTHLDVYKRQQLKVLNTFINTCIKAMTVHLLN